MAPPEVDEPNTRRSRIFDGALSSFLELGFEGASVDEIARRARVSKPTLYNHFDDKRALFVAVVRRECLLQSARIFQVDLGAHDIEAELRTIGQRLIKLSLSPVGQGFFRLIVSESSRFPELGRVFHASGPDLGARRLAVVLAAAIGRGELAITDVEMAAQQFVELCRAESFYRCLFQVVDNVSEAEADRVVNAAVSMFLRAYRP